LLVLHARSLARHLTPPRGCRSFGTREPEAENDEGCDRARPAHAEPGEPEVDVCVLAGRDLPEEAVLLVVGAGSEEQRVAKAVHVFNALAELERPQAVDHDRLVVRASQRSDALVAPVGLWL